MHIQRAVGAATYDQRQQHAQITSNSGQSRAYSIIAGPELERCTNFVHTLVQCQDLWERIATGGVAEIYRVDTTHLSLQMGSFGDLSKSDQPKCGRYIALKKAFLDESSKTEGYLTYAQEIDSEIKTLVKLGTLKNSHPNIIKMYGAYQSDPLHIVVLPYLPYCLERVVMNSWKGLEQDEFKAEEMFAISAQITSAVSFLHKEALCLHNDIKPANILFDVAHSAVLADFGLSDTLVGIEAPLFTKEHNGLYAPELIIDRKEQSTASDIFSLGYVFLTMLTGNHEIRAWSMQGKAFDNCWGKQDFQTFSKSWTILTSPKLRQAAEHLFTIMLGCIKEKPADRPTIIDVLKATQQCEDQYQHDDKELTEPSIKADDSSVSNLIKKMSLDGPGATGS